MESAQPAIPDRPVTIPAGHASLPGSLAQLPGARGLVLFVHGSGSSRLSPRNRFVAKAIARAGLATLLFDLLTDEEDADPSTRFQIDLLTERLLAATDWAAAGADTQELPLLYFGASTGAAAALRAAAERPDRARAIVSRGGRPDLAGAALAGVRAPTLLIVGGWDDVVLELNRRALARLTCERDLVIVPGATHLFEEPGALERVAQLAASWFLRHAAPAAPSA
jgi:putative phosphoribosyl transferase